MVQIIPGELIEAIFGPFIAQNFNKIVLLICSIGITILIYRGLRFRQWDYHQERRNHKKKKRTRKKPEYWYDSGWYWDEETQKWTPPDYLNEEARTRWRWDPEKRIWIDLHKNNDRKWAYNENAKIWVDASQVDYDRHERANAAVRAKWDQYYQEQAELEALRTPIHLTQEEQELAKQISIERTEMTFEEWKAARAKEQHPEQ